jgi:hypothetical protein
MAAFAAMTLHEHRASLWTARPPAPAAVMRGVSVAVIRVPGFDPGIDPRIHASGSGIGSPDQVRG